MLSISGIHFITVRTLCLPAQSTGGLYRWKDGRAPWNRVMTIRSSRFRFAAIRTESSSASMAPRYADHRGSTLTYKPQTARTTARLCGHGWSAEMRNAYMAHGSRASQQAPLDYKVDDSGEEYDSATQRCSGSRGQLPGGSGRKPTENGCLETTRRSVATWLTTLTSIRPLHLGRKRKDQGVKLAELNGRVTATLSAHLPASRSNLPGNGHSVFSRSSFSRCSRDFL